MNLFWSACCQQNFFYLCLLGMSQSRITSTYTIKHTHTHTTHLDTIQMLAHSILNGTYKEMNTNYVLTIYKNKTKNEFKYAYYLLIVEKKIMRQKKIILVKVNKCCSANNFR